MEVRKLLQSQRAIVTGASSGIGKGVALALAQAGAKVAVNYRAGGEKAALVVNEIKEAGGQAMAVQADLVPLQLHCVDSTWETVISDDDGLAGAYLLRNPFQQSDLRKWMSSLRRKAPWTRHRC